MRETIRYLLGDAICEEGGFPPWRTLLKHLRSKGYCGTKEGCAEGDCGACSVLVGELDKGGTLRYRVVNSCIALLGSIDGCVVLTIEHVSALGHRVQDLMVRLNGSQCGFCTPGFVMSLVGMCEDKNARVGSRSWVVENLAGNLCRCTGYGPIIAAGQRALQEKDTADWLAFQERIKSRLPLCNSDESVLVEYEGKKWYGVKNEDEWASFYASNSKGMVLVSGGTDIGVWVNKRFLRTDTMVDMSKMSALQEIILDNDSLTIGAAVTYNQIMGLASEHFPGMWRMWRRLGSRAIRDAGTIIGNLMTASPIGDSAPGLIALGSVVILRKGEKKREVALENFFTGYRSTVCKAGEYVRGLRIPLKYGHRLQCYKLSKRYDQDISTVSCAGVLEGGEVRVVYGGMAATVKRARKVEAVLRKGLSDDHIDEACKALERDFSPMSDMRGSTWYRLEASKGLLRRLCAGLLGKVTVDLSYEESFASMVAARGVGFCEQEEASAEGSLGRALAHDSARLHVEGAALYTDDMAERMGSLVTYVFKSGVGRGKLLRLDVSEVEKSAGVQAVITATTIKEYGGHNDTSPTGSGDDPVFVEVGGEIGFYGEVLFAVVGSDMDCLREASKKAVVDWEVEEAHLDLLSAKEELSPPLEFARGSKDAVLGAGCDFREQGVLAIGGQDHFYLEGQVSLALGGEDGGMSVWTSSQHPSEVQQVVADVLGKSASAVKVMVRRMGGGFGGKETQAAQWAAIAALGARKTGSAVRVCLDRDDDMILTGKRHAMSVAYDISFNKHGRLGSADVDIAGDCGCSLDLSNAVVDRAMFHIDNVYDMGAVRIEGKRMRTNKVSATAFRGFGGPQGMMGGEWFMEVIARKLGKDPLDVRYENFYGGKNGEVTPYHMTLRDNCIRDLVSQLEHRSAYRERRKQIRMENENAWKSGSSIRKGLALTPVKFGISFTTKFLNQGGALLNVYKDGSILLNHGGTEMGQGLFVKVVQLVADSFCVHPSRIRVSAASTDKVPNTSPTAASSGTDINGAAALNAAETIKRRILSHVASHYGVPSDAVRFGYECVIVGDKTVTFAEAISICYLARVSLSATGFYRTPKIDYDRAKARGSPFYYFAYGAAVSEVAIDILTGESRTLRVDILHDVGNSINPAVDRGQIEGGFIQGMGWLTSEELVWSKDGQLLTHAPSTYKIPVAGCCPLDMRIDFYNNSKIEMTPHRSKAVGEPPLMLAISVFHAIADSVVQTSALTVAKRSAAPLTAPATPETILRAVKTMQGV